MNFFCTCYFNVIAGVVIKQQQDEIVCSTFSPWALNFILVFILMFRIKNLESLWLSGSFSTDLRKAQLSGSIMFDFKLQTFKMGNQK